MRSPATKRATDIDRAVGVRICIRRNEIGMSQEKLAGLVGVARSQIIRYESGALRASGSRLVAIAEALGAPVTYFLEQSAEDVEAASGALLKTPGAVALLQAYAAMPNTRQRAALVGLMWALALQGAEGSDEAVTGSDS